MPDVLRMYQRIIIFWEDKLRNIGNEKGKRIWRELGEKGRVLGREGNFIILRYFKNLTVLTLILFFFLLFVCFLSHGQEPIS